MTPKQLCTAAIWQSSCSTRRGADRASTRTHSTPCATWPTRSLTNRWTPVSHATRASSTSSRFRRPPPTHPTSSSPTSTRFAPCSSIGQLNALTLQGAKISSLQKVISRSKRYKLPLVKKLIFSRLLKS